MRFRRLVLAAARVLVAFWRMLVLIEQFVYSSSSLSCAMLRLVCDLIRDHIALTKWGGHTCAMMDDG